MTFLDQLPRNIQDNLERVQIESAQEVLCKSEISLARLRFKPEDISLMKQCAAQSLKIPVYTVKQLLENSTKLKYLSFGCESLDSCTKGGILTRGITEICGESGSGKTQMLLQLSLMVQLPENMGGLNKGAIYICTEEKFPSKRLFQIIQAFNEKYSSNVNYGNNIFIEHIWDAYELLQCVFKRTPDFVKIKKIGLIVIDSIAGIFRNERNYIRRAKNMRALASGLLNLVETYGCVVICSNQVSSARGSDNKFVLTPCLGIAWSNLVRTRYKITKNVPIDEPSTSHESSSGLRRFDVLFSPDAPCNNCKFLITEKGIKDTIYLIK